MRFFKVVKPNYGLEVGDNIVLSRYYKGISVLSDGNSRTKYNAVSKRKALGLILDDYVVPMSDSEIRKLIPYLPAKCLEYDNVPF